MPAHIPSEDLTMDMVPDPETATEGEAWAFFHTFHAYIYWGGFKEAFKANDRAAIWQQEWLARQDPEPEFFRYPEPHMDHLRTDLFLECRSARHCGTGGPSLLDGLRTVRHWLASE